MKIEELKSVITEMEEAEKHTKSLKLFQGAADEDTPGVALTLYRGYVVVLTENEQSEVAELMSMWILRSIHYEDESRRKIERL